MTEAQITALEDQLSTMTEQEVAQALNNAPVESQEADIIAGECERRNIDV